MPSLGRLRRFSDQEKLRILEEGCQNGILNICAVYVQNARQFTTFTAPRNKKFMVVHLDE